METHRFMLKISDVRENKGGKWDWGIVENALDWRRPDVRMTQDTVKR